MLGNVMGSHAARLTLPLASGTGSSGRIVQLLLASRMILFTLLSHPKKSKMVSDGHIAMYANLSRISLSSDSVANSSLKKAG